MEIKRDEYYAFKGGDKGEAFDDYSVFGGLPAVALMTTDEQKSTYLIAQMENLYLNDIKNRYSVRDGKALREVLDVIASGISTLTNPKNIANTKFVIVEKSMKPRRDEKGYVMMGVKEFLLDSDSLEV